MQIGCIIMASGLSSRYGKNKLLEKICGQEVILHTARHIQAAGITPLAVTRSDKVKALLDVNQIPCILHEGERKSDTIHTGIRQLDSMTAGYLFMPADQPLLLPDTLKKLIECFKTDPQMPVRVGYQNTAGSPVLFPGKMREDLLSYHGDRGGMEVLQRNHLSCTVIQAAYEWELWDVDTPENMAQVKAIFPQFERIISG